MDVLLQGLVEALRLLFTGDDATWAIAWLTLQVSLTATALALGIGIPLAVAIALTQFPGRRVVQAAANTGMGMPPVVVGLFVTVLLWRSGPLGGLGLLYTPTAMVIAQAVIATPVVAALVAAALQQIDPDFRVQMQALGASRLRSLAALLSEARLPLLAAAMAAFGAVISEVGAAQMVGGNIAGQTRVLTTAAVLATSRGQFALAIAFGLILLAIAFAVNLTVTLAQQRRPHPMSPRISCRGLRVTARGRELLHVEDLHVSAGQTLAVLGPNGAGKSTLLRALALLGPHHGTGQILLDGRCATPPVMRAAVAAVLQRPILRRGTVAANVASGLRLRGISRGEALRRSVPWLDALQITHLVRRDARTLSGGEAQRVSIARALAIEPRVLLLDEPFAGLDATTRTDLLADLRTVLGQLRAATILVTHDRHEALALADQTALLIAGNIRQYGATSDVLDNPVDTDCARLVGYTNLLTPALTGHAQPLVARPEHCLPLTHPAHAPPDALVIPATLRRIVPLGGATRLDVDTDAARLACLTTDDPYAHATTPGATIWVAVTDTRKIDLA